MNTSFIVERLRHYGSRSLSTAVAGLFLMSVIMANTSVLHAQSTTQSPVEATIEGTLPISSLPEHEQTAADTIDPTKYFFVFDDDSPERKAYAGADPLR